MSRTQRMLGAALVVQLVLVLVTWRGAGSTTRPPDSQAILEFDKADVISLRIEGERKASGEPGPSVELSKTADGWVVTSAGDYEAKAEKVEKVLDQLASLQVGDSIASNRANHEALRVGERNYGRKITIETSDGASTLVLGRGARSSVHVRRSDRDDVHVGRGLSIWNIPSEARGYIDTQFVSVDPDEITSVSIDNRHGVLTFAKRDDGWELAELPAGEELDDAAVKSFIGAVTRVNLTSPVGRDVRSDYGLTDGATVVIAAGAGDDTAVFEYVVGDAAERNDYYARSEDGGFVVRIPKWNAEQARDKTAADFAKKSAEDG